MGALSLEDMKISELERKLKAKSDEARNLKVRQERLEKQMDDTRTTREKAQRECQREVQESNSECCTAFGHLGCVSGGTLKGEAAREARHRREALHHSVAVQVLGATLPGANKTSPFECRSKRDRSWKRC